MADSLDDFFAKKDKKKGKGKAVLSAETLVKELEEGAKQTEYPVRKEAKTSTAIELLGLDADDADWRDFEDIEKRDYTGLKVKEMSLQDQTEDDQRRMSADQIEPVPDLTAWRIKDDSAPNTEEPAPITTAAAIAAAGVATSTISQQARAPNTPDIVADNTNTSTSASVTAAAADESITNENPEAKTSQSANSTASSSSENPEKKGDKPSAKYVPPQGRNLMGGSGGEVKVLEPVRLSKTKTTSTRQENMPNLQDPTLFPSLG